MALFIAEDTDSTFVVRPGENTLQAAASALTAEGWADAAALSAATAEAAAGPTYASTAAGLAATTSGEAFAVDAGGGLVSVYLNSSGTAVLQRTLATTGALAASGGAGLVGVIQSGTGATARTVQSKMRDVVSVKDFGAVGDGVVDDTVAIQNAATACGVTGANLTFPSGAIYKITNTITIPAGVGVDMRGARIVYEGPKTKPALVFGASGTSNQGSSGRRMSFLGLDVRNGTAPVAADLADTAFVGIRFWNLRRCGDVHIENVYGFTRNVEFVSDQSLGSAYNTVRLGTSANSFEHTVVRTSGASGFTTEFLFLGGSWINDDTYPSTLGSRGVFVTWDKSSSNRGADNCVFVKPCFELGERAGAGDRIAAYFDGAGKNFDFQDVRWENCDGPFMYADGGSSGPTVNPFATNSTVTLLTASGSRHATNPIFETGRAVGNRLLRTNTCDTAWGDVLRPRDISGCIKAGGAANEKFLTGEWLAFTSGSPTPSKTITSNLVKMGPDYIELAAGGSVAIGVAIDTRKRKSFVVKVNHQGSSYRGRLLLRMYDKYGNQLTSGTGTGSDLLEGYWGLGSATATVLPFSTSTFGHHWRNLNSNFTSNAQSFRVAASVAYVIVAVSNQSDEAARFSGMEILMPPTGSRAGDDPAAFWPMFDSAGIPLSSAKPNNGGSTFGRHYKGEKIGNTAAAAGQPAGWVCATSGVVAPAWAISTAYVVDDLRTNGANVYVCKTAGTSAGSGGPTGTGTAITDGTAIWDYYAPLATFVTEASLT